LCFISVLFNKKLSSNRRCVKRRVRSCVNEPPFPCLCKFKVFQCFPSKAWDGIKQPNRQAGEEPAAEGGGRLQTGLVVRSVAVQRGCWLKEENLQVLLKILGIAPSTACFKEEVPCDESPPRLGGFRGAESVARGGSLAAGRAGEARRCAESRGCAQGPRSKIRSERLKLESFAY